MVRNAGAYFILFLAASTSNQAVAQTAGGMMNMFTAIMRAAIVDHARSSGPKSHRMRPRVLNRPWGNRDIRLVY